MSIQKMIVLLTVLTVVAFATEAQALRPLSADRPDVTESAYTVDAGHVQVEVSLYEYAYDADAWQILPTNLKVGLHDQSDLQIVFTPYNVIGGGDDGSGDLILRNKWNLWGNDAGRTALAIMPFMKIPTNQGDVGNAYFEGGLILPFAVEISESIGVGLMGELDFIYDDVDDNYVSSFVHTATLGTVLLGDLGGFIEFAGEWLLYEASEYAAQFNIGLTYALMEYLQLDSGGRFGLTDNSDDLELFSGFTAKF